jgi:hypothetical protein
MMPKPANEAGLCVSLEEFTATKLVSGRYTLAFFKGARGIQLHQIPDDGDGDCSRNVGFF